jgi:predicted GNAT superfamily acetyltransferase
MTSITKIVARDMTADSALRAQLLDLNNSHARELSWLEPDRLTYLVSQAFRAMRIGEVEAMLIAFDQDADYRSPNFLWFRDRFARFVYVDRIVVASEARGRGYARCLYRDLFNQAAQAGHDKIVCEVNSTPPNPNSDAFHASLGFSELAQAQILDGLKTVRYLYRQLEPRDASDP